MEEKEKRRKRDLLFLIGTLSHASRAVRAGRSFLRQLINLLTTVKQPHNFVTLRAGAHSDIEWWFRHCETWNRSARVISTKPSKRYWEAEVVSDASGRWDCGAISGKQ